MSDNDSETEIGPETKLKFYSDLVNSERQAIWARTAAMLVGNSFILNAIKSEATASEPFMDAIFSVAGISICSIWGVMTYIGWGYFHRYNNVVLKIVRKKNQKQTLSSRSTDPIFVCTMLLVAVFWILFAATLVANVHESN